MAGIGIQLNKVFKKRTITSSVVGVGMSIVYTIAPMLLIMLSLLIMYRILGFDTVGYAERELFSCSVLYIFIFSLLSSTAFNSTLSKYIADRTFERNFADIRPCLIIGIVLKLTISTVIAVPFYLWEIFIGKVPVYYVMTTYMGFLGLSLVFAVMLYGVVIKQFKQISGIFLAGSAVMVLFSALFRYVFNMSITYSMLLAMTIGFYVISFSELFLVMRRFPENSHRYRDVFTYLKYYWRLVVSDFFYTFGLFCHNFVFWGASGRLEIVNTYVCHQPYDMATCLAMFTNISATVLFVSKVEMHFFERYSDFNSAVAGGSFSMIEKAKKRMFSSLSQQLKGLAFTQFAISVIIFFIAEIALPYMGFSGTTMDIYPLMSVGYFISFLMYSNLLFLQYFTDYTGAALTGIIYTSVGMVGAYFSQFLSAEWFGLGYTVGALCAYMFSYLRLSKMEKNIYTHVFCAGHILDTVQEDKPDSEVYNKSKLNETKVIKSDN